MRSLDAIETIKHNAEVARGNRRQYDGANIRFFVEAVHNEAASNEAGRAIYDEKEMIEVHWPGSKDRISRAVKDGDIRDYPEAYKAFKAGKEQEVEGTRLEQWAMLPVNLCKEFKHLGIHSIEQLAACNDAVKAKLGPAQRWIGEANDYLKEAEKGSKVTALRAENKSLKKEMTELKRQMKVLSNRLKEEIGVPDL